MRVIIKLKPLSSEDLKNLDESCVKVDNINNSLTLNSNLDDKFNFD